MKKHFKKYFIPHEENQHTPHILRETAVTVLALLALAMFVFSSIHTAILVTSSDFLAAVLPRVLVDITNESRLENAYLQLTVDPTLTAAAQLKADHMAEHGYFAHVSPDGITPWHWFLEAGYQFIAAGENLAVNFSDSEDVVDAWMESPGHRANILNGDFTEIGIATARGEYKGRETVFVVQLFGRPAESQVASVPESVAQAPIEDTTEPIPAVAAETAPAPERTVETVEVEPAVEEPVEGEEPVETPESVVTVEVPDTLEVTRDDNMFLAVRDTAAEPETQELAGTEAVGLLAPTESSFTERLFAEPRTLLNIFYIILAAVVLLALILNIAIEVEHQHPKHVAYGILLLMLIVGLAYIYRSYIFTELLII